MSVDEQALLSDCQDQLEYLEADLAAQAEAEPELAARLRAEYALAREAGRIGDAFETWRGEQATQAAVQWALGGVFVRFLEDNGLLPEPLLTGKGDQGRLAEAAEQAFIAANPALHERHWFLHVFRTVGRLPGAGGLFDEAHNPVFRWPLTPEAAQRLLQFWRRTDPATGQLAHDFTDPEWDTRFLGDLYQELSESARKKYALLQTPIFVEEFILDRTLGEAILQLPLPAVTVIDPTCGSGHFLLGAFARLLAAWERQEPGTPREALAQRALDQVAGVDLNPFAVAIARFRLLVAALRACGVGRLDRAPAFRMHIAVGDSLLHGDEPGSLGLGDGGTGRFVGHVFSEEDLAEVNSVLGRRYAAVVGNPPYIVPKDKALNKAYRERYERSCHMKYALSAPFIERFWQLAATDAGGGVAGWVGQITANSFMKREFGKKVVEEFFPRVDLTHVIDTAGAYVPGHGTPTVVLFGRARAPHSGVIRAVLGIRGEPATPVDPSRGEVWTAILNQVDEPGTESLYVSVTDVARATFSRHPWSIGGGGAAELKEMVEGRGEVPLGDIAESIGFSLITGEDEVLIAEGRYWRTRGMPSRPIASGDEVRDWTVPTVSEVFFPYSDAPELNVVPLSELRSAAPHLWPYRTSLRLRLMFGKLPEDVGQQWHEIRFLARNRVVAPQLITFAEVATHNHFVLTRGGGVFKQTAPVIKLPAAADEARYVGLLGLLNSSTACFWLKQVAHNKGSTVDQRGARQRTAPFEDFYQYNGTKVGAFPVASERPDRLARQLDELARERLAELPASLGSRGTPDRAVFDAARAKAERLLSRMVALQEELDWRCYELYGVTTNDLTYRNARGAEQEPPALRLGERAFEILLARRMATGEEETTWFERHTSTATAEVPAEWPADYRALVERRIAAIESDRSVGLIERPEYKRRWNVESWDTLEEEALRTWLLDRLETPTYWPDVAFQSTRDLAARAALDPDFGRVASFWARAEGVEQESTIRRLLLDAAVPFLPVLRYTESGRDKRRVWERTWELQRQEDAVDARVAPSFTHREGESDQSYNRRLAEEQKRRRVAEVGDIPKPPRYTGADFQSPVFWNLRGAMDVPRERFILFPLVNRDGDDAPIFAWAGWNFLQQAQALTAWYTERTEREGWSGERLIPLLAGMAELLPWLKQWHNEIDPEFGDRPGDVYESWLEGELLQHGLTRAALDAWEPPRAARRRGRRTAATQE